MAYNIEFNTPSPLNISDLPSHRNSSKDPPQRPIVFGTSTTEEAQSSTKKPNPPNTQKPKTKSKSKATTPGRQSNAKPSTDFQLDADASKPDPLLMKPVAFDVDDKLHGSRLYEHFGGDEKAHSFLKVKNGKRVLLGTVIRATKKKSKQKSSQTVYYDVQWEQTTLGITPVDISLISDAITLYKSFAATRSNQHGSEKKGQKREPFSPELRNLLYSVDDFERGKPYSSDEEESDDNLDCNVEDYIFHRQRIDDEGSTSEEVNNSNEPAQEFLWSIGKLAAPPDRSNRSPSHVIPSLTGNFATPIQSLLAFIPLKIFNSIAHYSNLYAHATIEKTENGKISGKKWDNDININEIMKFFGILIKMVLRPTPGQSYPYCWHNVEWHPYTVYMRLRRFQQIRSVLHFNDNSNMDGSDDAAFKVWTHVDIHFSSECFLPVYVSGPSLTKLCEEYFSTVPGSG